MGAYEKTLEKYRKQQELDGKVGAPPGNPNACKPGANREPGEGSNCPGGGGVAGPGNVKGVAPKGAPAAYKKALKEAQQNYDWKVNQLKEQGETEAIANADKWMNDKISELDGMYLTPRAGEEENLVAKNLLGIETNYGNIDKSTAQEITASLDKSFKEYPELKNIIKSINTGKTVKQKGFPSALADWISKTGTMRWNESAVGEKFKSDMAQGEKDGWFSQGGGSIKGVMDHETGHALDTLYESKYGTELSENSEFSKVYDDFNAKARSDNNYYKNNLSTYAGTNAKEFIAESWSEYKNNPNPRPAAAAVGKIIEKYLKPKP